MKELYMTPEAKLVCFAPMQNIADIDIDADKLFGDMSGIISGKEGDIDIPAVNG